MSEPQDERIRGGFPGGPRRPGGEPAPPTRGVRTMDEVEAGIARRQLHLKAQGRRSRVVWTVVAVMGLAAAIGTWLGLQTHRTPEQLRTESSARIEQDNFISREVNRTLLELWRMEDVEALRGRGR